MVETTSRMGFISPSYFVKRLKGQFHTRLNEVQSEVLWMQKHLKERAKREEGRSHLGNSPLPTFMVWRIIEWRLSVQHQP